MGICHLALHGLYLKSYNPKQESKHIIYLDTNNIYNFVMYRCLLTSKFKWIDPNEFDMNTFTSNSSKRWVLEVYLEYPKDLPRLHNDHPLAHNKTEIRRKMLPNYQLNIADLCNTSIGKVKQLMPNCFIKKSMCFIKKTYNFIWD